MHNSINDFLGSNISIVLREIVVCIQPVAAQYV